MTPAQTGVDLGTIVCSVKGMLAEEQIIGFVIPRMQEVELRIFRLKSSSTPREIFAVPKLFNQSVIAPEASEDAQPRAMPLACSLFISCESRVPTRCEVLAI